MHNTEYLQGEKNTYMDALLCAERSYGCWATLFEFLWIYLALNGEIEGVGPPDAQVPKHFHSYTSFGWELVLVSVLCIVGLDFPNC